MVDGSSMADTYADGAAVSSELDPRVAEVNLAKELADKLQKVWYTKTYAGCVPLERQLTVAVIVDSIKLFQARNPCVVVLLKKVKSDTNLLLMYFEAAE